MDKLGKQVYQNPELAHYYRGLVPVPTLQMVDDVLAIQKCSAQSLHQNSVVNTFMELEKLKLSETKYHKLHIGNNHINYPGVKVHESPMNESNMETYLGDQIHNSGKI